MKTMFAVAVCVLLGTTMSCFPYHGSAGHSPIPTTPVVFVDGKTYEQLDRVLIIPRYSSFRGLSTGAGHGPGGGNYRRYLADPFIYKRGELFEPRLPKSTGIIWGPGWGFTGKGISIDGIAVVARGYRPLWIGDPWGASSRPEPISLMPLPPPDADLEVERILELLRRSKLVGMETDPFENFGGETDIRFSEAQMTVIEQFLRGSI
jgi:hypothetical protein